MAGSSSRGGRPRAMFRFPTSFPTTPRPTAGLRRRLCHRRAWPGLEGRSTGRSFSRPGLGTIIFRMRRGLRRSRDGLEGLNTCWAREYQDQAERCSESRIQPEGREMKIVNLRSCVLTLCFLCVAQWGDLASAQTAPPATSPATQRAGRRGGNRGGPMTASEKAEIAKLAELPGWKAGDGDGNYSIGPDYAPAPEITPKEGVPAGKVQSFILNAADSKFYPDTGKRGALPTRKVTVYIPAQYKPGTAAALIVSADAYGAGKNQLPHILDNMIAEHRLPVIIAVMIANGGGDGGGSERGLEYDTVSGKYAEFVEAEILPRVEKEYGVTLSKDPDARMTLGGSSGGAVSLTMAW